MKNERTGSRAGDSRLLSPALQGDGPRTFPSVLSHFKDPFGEVWGLRHAGSLLAFKIPGTNPNFFCF